MSLQKVIMSFNKKIAGFLILLLITAFFLSGCQYFGLDEASTEDSPSDSADTNNSPDKDKAPEVSSAFPSDNETGVATNTVIIVEFNKAMDTSTVTTNTEDANCSGTVQVSAISFISCVQMASDPSANANKEIFTLTPKSNLVAETTYQIKVTNGVMDLLGNNLQKEFITNQGFTAETETDTTAPTVESRTPADQAVGAAKARSKGEARPKIGLKANFFRFSLV